MKFLQIMLCSLTAAVVFSLGAVPNGDFQNGKEGWAGTGTVQDGVLTVVDSSATSGVYAISKNGIPVDPGQDYCFGVLCRTKGVISRSQMYIRVFDKAGKAVKSFFTAGYKGTEWKMLRGRIAAKDLPTEAASVKIILQPAAGAAEAIGQADFRNVFFYPEKMASPLVENSLNITEKTFFKTEQIYLAETDLQQASFRVKNNQTRMELSWAASQLPAFFTFLNSQNIGKVRIHYWNDVQQEFKFWQDMEPSCHGEFRQLNLTGVPLTRKLLLDFGTVPLVFGKVEFHVRSLECENWHAYWIWFTSERVEHTRCWFRRELVLPSKPVRAMLQSAADDGAVLSVNGKTIGSAGSWKQPACQDIASLLQKGKNVLGAVVRQARYDAGLLAELDLIFEDGSSQKIITDRSWLYSQHPRHAWDQPEFSVSGWAPSVELCRPPMREWGKIPYRKNTPKKRIILRNNEIPEVLEAGKKYCLHFDLSAAEAPSVLTPVDLVLRRNSREFHRIRLGVWEPGSQRNRYSLQWHVNPYLISGDYMLDLEIPQYEVIMENHPFGRSIPVANHRKVKAAAVQIRSHLGMPTLFINGQPYFNYMGALVSRRYEYARSYQKAGVNLFHIMATVKYTEDGKCDFSDLDQSVAAALYGNSDAYLTVRILLQNSMTDEFRRRYPEELVRFDDGSVSGSVSLASTVWRDRVSSLLTDMVKHIQESPYADRLIGIFPADGEEGQWMHRWNGHNPSHSGALSDYSLPMLRYFRTWLQKKYKTDADLQAAWGQPQVTLKTAAIPSHKQRIGSDKVLRSLPQERPAVDYAEALSDVVADSILQQLEVIKKASSNRLLTGILYGHIIDLGDRFLGEQVGYLKMRRIIESPYLDYVAGPLHYAKDFRDIGSPSSFDYPAPAVLRLHNKIWLQEDDLRTHLTNPPGYAMSVRSPAQTSQVLAREFAKGLCSGAGMYFCDGPGEDDRGWLDDPETVQTLSELKKIAADATKYSLASNAEVAVVFSDISFAYLRSLPGRSSMDAIMRHLIYNRDAISRLGAPFDEYLVGDFLNASMPDYKLYIFMNAFYLTAEERTAIRTKLNRTGATALWFYAPGVFDENEFNPALAGALTGIPLQIADHRISATMYSVKNNCKFGLPASVTFRPVFVPQAQDQEILATWKDGKTPALVRLGKHYFSAFPGLTPELFRSIAEKAGVFIYSSDNDAVYVNASYLAVHTSVRQGARKIKLPHGKLFRQLWPKRSSDFVNSIQFYSKSPQTLIFQMKEQ